VTDFSTAIWMHVIAAIPPTLAALAALITALRTKRDTAKIVVLANGRIDRLEEELKMARIALTQKEPS